MSFPKTIPLLLLTLFLCIQCKNEDSSKNPLIASENWRKETFDFPLAFAPSLTHKGTEYVRFTPGWSEQDSKDFFSYVFLWDIDKNPRLSARMLETEMEVYFDGIMHNISKKNSKHLQEIPKAKAFFEKLNEHSYVGKILTYDAFFTKKEISLTITVEYIPCDILKKQLVLFKISPQQINHPVWNKLNSISIDLQCS
ncbi:hypothetical protein [Aquimarina sp. RZ0]|uniref:hypothetical protein n=1 Tax=Aquimarina sp. RZ0 TaxID=2607730 RepID=UPI0011F1C91A|nr:hypothetical protein [Aquimarina sp. RZ0]KAA1240352.1 hypothetical protein F0000_27055 [Aquimarina sp. RZ0]